MSAIAITSSASLEALASKTTFVLLDFYADWCPPCRMIAPLFKSLAYSHSAEGKLAFAKVNVDQQQQLAMRYGVTAMPTFVLLRNGKAVQTARGANLAAVQALVKLAKVELSNEAKKEEKDDGGEAVSGGYSMGVGARGDWKMKLSG